MTDFGRRPGNMLKSVYDPNADGIIAIAQTQADMTKAVYDEEDDGVVEDSAKLQASSKAQVQDHTPKSHTHTESEISDLDHDALKVKGVIINDAAIGDQKVLAYDLATERIVYIDQAPSGAVIKNIQAVAVTLPASTISATATITEVDPSNTVLFFNGHNSPSDAGNARLTATLTNSTTVTVESLGAYAGPCTVWVTVVEFEDGTITGVQRGLITITTPDLTATATITAVDTSKSVVILLGTRTNASLNEANAGVVITNSTTVTATRGATTATTYVSFEVVEFL